MKNVGRKSDKAKSLSLAYWAPTDRLESKGDFVGGSDGYSNQLVMDADEDKSLKTNLLRHRDTELMPIILTEYLFYGKSCIRTDFDFGSRFRRGPFS